MSCRTLRKRCCLGSNSAGCAPSLTSLQELRTMLDPLAVAPARVGLIIPSSNRLTEPHMHHYAPAGVQVHVTRLRMTGPHHVGLDQLMPRIVESTGALADARCDVIVFHCTADRKSTRLNS